jgi:diaminohydroxyphosphoribosylaminopyrimidine deaminase/5-amino-6-(5-phosphoribosylamino)uracil reductase
VQEASNYMVLAVQKAWEYQGLTYPNPAVGAVVTYQGAVIAVEAHQKAGQSHAEVLALLRAYEVLSHETIPFDRGDALRAHQFLRTLPNDFFAQCTIYVTLEPCAHHGKTPSCASLLAHLNLSHVHIGIADPIKGHDGGAKQLPRVSMGILEEACRALIEPFLIWQRRAFVLFKMAQTMNGRIGGGYLSCKHSLRHVHAMREVCDRLVIGGNTVRVDRPTLDCRFVSSHAPDIYIYSQQARFDETIPLFGIKGRRVEIGGDLSFLDTPSFVIIEGGEAMLHALKDRIDWLLIYQTPKLSEEKITYNCTMPLALLHHARCDVDLMIWSRNLGD